MNNLKAAMDRLRAEASRGPVSSTLVFTITDPIMDAIAREPHDTEATKALAEIMLAEIIKAWDLPHPFGSAIGDTMVMPSADMERWLRLTMHPVITKARAVLKDLA